MKSFALFATGIMALGLATGGASAGDASAESNFRQIMSTIANVGSATTEIGQMERVFDVRLVQLDNFPMGENEQAFIGALSSQRGTAQVYALRSAVAGNQQLVTALQRLHINFRSIVAIEISKTGRITVYTFGASA